MKSILLLIAALAGALQGPPTANPPNLAAPAHPPKPAPSLYVSTRFGLAMQVPQGLSICPLPKNWSGAVDGTVLFLEPPSGCVEASAGNSSTRLTSGFAPSISLRYRANSGRSNQLDGDIPPARSSMELASQLCATPEISARFNLFGQPAVTCRSDLPGDKARVVLLALYDSGSKLLIVTLVTAQERLAADEKVLANIAVAITRCGDASASKGEIPACPNGTAW